MTSPNNTSTFVKNPLHDDQHGTMPYSEEHDDSKAMTITAQPPSHTSQKASDVFIQCLVQEGIDYIFGVPGEENLDFVESLYQQHKIRLIVTRHEQAAGFMAATIGRLTGKPGVCLSTLGPGATNFVTSSAFAQLGGMPMLMITGQKPIKHSKQGHFQIVNVVEMMRPLTKFTTQVVSASRIPSIVREAFRIAQEERPGAVHIELPEDIAAEHIKTTPYIAGPTRRPVADIKAVRLAVELIKNSKRPMLLIGAGANRKMTQKMLREFVDKTGIPFFNTQMGKGVIDERSPHYIGTAALSSKDIVHKAVDAADLIINVGHDVIEKPPFFMHQGSSQKVIHINFYSAQVDEVYHPDLEVVGDIANAIWQIKEMLTEIPNWDFSIARQTKAEIEADIMSLVHSDAFPIKPQRIVYDIRQTVNEDAILSLDNGMYKLWFSRHYPAYKPNTLLLDNALATMGAGLPSAIAAKLVYPDRQVVAICGDGGFMMNSQELETAVRLNMNLVVILINDNAFGMIKWKQQDGGFHNFGLDLQNPDFIKYAEAYHAHGYRCEKADDLTRLLKQCLESKGVYLIEVPIDYSENQRVLTKR